MSATPSRTDLAPYGALILRAGPGAVYLAHALAKPPVFTLPGTAAFFEQNGFPGWSAYPAFAAELAGGLMLILGVRARLAAALVPVTAGALLVHLPYGRLFASLGGGREYLAFLIVALFAWALLGDGAFALAPSRLGRAAGYLAAR
jgi:putative oxidoreductase